MASRQQRAARSFGSAGPVPCIRTASMVVGLVVSILSTGVAKAHPHVWIEASVDAIFEPDGRWSSLRQTWIFDYEFSDILFGQMDINGDGSLATEEAAQAIGGPLSFLTDTKYYTRVTVAGRPVEVGAAFDTEVTYRGARVRLAFSLPLLEPAAMTLGGGIDIFDPELYYDIQFGSPPYSAINAPTGCTLSRRTAANIDPVAATLLRRLGLAADDVALSDPAFGFSARVEINCPE